MAGSEQIGLHGADPDLFEGAVWVLTPTAATDLEAFDRLKGVVMSLGADVLVLSPADHDRLVAVVSHVPHLVAATLMNAASAGAEQDGALLRLAAGGFRDMTRVAAGHPGIWPDICAENAAPIVDALDALVTDLARHARPRRHAGPRRAARRAAAGQRGPAQPARPRRAARPPGRAAHPGARPGRASWPRSPRWPPTPASASTTSRSPTRPRARAACSSSSSTAPTPTPWRPRSRRAATAAGPSSCRDRAPHPRRRRRRALPRHRAHARGEVDLAPGRARSARWPRGRRSIHGLSDGADVAASLAAVEAMGAGVERHDDGTVVVARGPGAAPPARRTPRLRELRDLHAPAGRPGGRVRLGDRAGRRRLALGPAHGPGGRAARPHGRRRARAAASAACRRCASGAARCTASTGRPRWPAPR